MSSGGTVKAFRVPGGQLVRLETDIEFDEITAIATKHELNFMFMLASPELGTGKSLADLYRLCCRTAGVEVPEKLTARLVLDALEDVEDDLPEYYEDGHPKVADPTTD